MGSRPLASYTGMALRHGYRTDLLLGPDSGYLYEHGHVT